MRTINGKQERQATILAIEQDDRTRPLLKHNLCSQGYRVLLALDFEDALERAWGRREPPDVVLIAQFKLPLEETVNMGRYVRKSAGFPSHTPIIVMAECYGVELEGKDVKVGASEYVTYLEDAQQLLNLLRRLCSV